MTGLRIVLITSRYWPHAGDMEATAASIAEGLGDLGTEVVVLTAGWGANWPRRLAVRGVEVERLPHAPLGGWSSFRYLTALHRWLRQNRRRFDVAYVMNLRLEAYSVVGALDQSAVPVIAHARESGRGGDAWWQENGRFGSRAKDACQRAAAIVTPCVETAEELVQHGYSLGQLHVIPWGVHPSAVRSPDTRLRARAALAEINHDLAAAEYAPVALYAGRMDDFGGLSRLLEAWEPVSRIWPAARLWMIGDGPARERLCDQAIELELRYQTFFPGSFEDRSELYHAADVLVAPTTGQSQLLLEGLASGLPAVVADSPERHGMMEQGRHGWLLPSTDIAGWTAALSQLFESPRLAAEMGQAVRRHVEQKFPRAALAESIQRLCQQRLT